jgi:hypothetical protein
MQLAENLCAENFAGLVKNAKQPVLTIRPAR